VAFALAGEGVIKGAVTEVVLTHGGRQFNVLRVRFVRLVDELGHFSANPSTKSTQSDAWLWKIAFGK
jgi:hypothetical protein